MDLRDINNKLDLILIWY